MDLDLIIFYKRHSQDIFWIFVGVMDFWICVTDRLHLLEPLPGEPGRSLWIGPLLLPERIGVLLRHGVDVVHVGHHGVVLAVDQAVDVDSGLNRGGSVRERGHSELRVLKGGVWQRRAGSHGCWRGAGGHGHDA